MSWATHHSKSNRYVSLAELAVRNGDSHGWLELYRHAAEEEALALASLSNRKTQTRGVTAVRAVALWLNAGNLQQARGVADQLLKDGSLPQFAVAQLQAMFIGNNVLIAPPSKGTTKGGKLLGSAQIPLLVSASAPQLTTLTPNSNCSAVGSGDINNSTLMQFMTPANKIPYWNAMASEALSPVVLPADTGNAIVTFKQGLTVSYYAAGAAYYVFLNGKIVDSGTVYPFTGAVIYTSS
jgi:hypothetical protein